MPCRQEMINADKVKIQDLTPLTKEEIAYVISVYEQGSGKSNV